MTRGRGDSLWYVDIMMNEMTRSTDRRGSGGACATLCGNTESAASSKDIGDITVKVIES